ncbi:MAG TPA: glycoside hydrolase family 9 protein, partial [Prolixibacteraceae bacterium]|nr:glycoside hydrolase family 9 protein [Prolixibacteraceae bacterium]
MTKPLFLILLFLSFTSWASDLKSVSVLTDQILVLHFSDGTIHYHGYHQKGTDDLTVKDELNTEAVADVSTYSITSSGDAAYTAPVKPVAVGRKSKPSGMSMKCMPNTDNRCMSDYVLEHFVYLYLDKPLIAGQTYVLKTGPDLSGAKNAGEFTLTYHPSHTRSLAVHVNQLGFVPEAPRKYAYISHWMGDRGPLDLDKYGKSSFHLIRTKDGKKVFTGTISKQKDFETGGPDGPAGQGPNGNFVAADVWQCDFSAFSKPGEYVVSVEGMGVSYPFKIDADVYREPFVQTCRSLYHHRSGIALTEPFTTYEREAPHNPSTNPNFRLRYTKFRNMDSQWESAPLNVLEPAFDDSFDTRNIWGWYHDAGDWDAYVTHAVVPAYLMTTFELKPRNFSDGELNIPESNNGIPDILDEAGWLLNHYRRAKGPTGGIAGSRIEGDNYPNKEAGGGLPSYEDIRPQWIVYAEEPRMTFIYARLAAQMAYNYKIAAKNRLLSPKINYQDSMAVWSAEALKAFSWAQQNLWEGDEAKIKSHRAAASAWLYKLTGDVQWLKGFKADLEVTATDNSSYGKVEWGIWAYVTAHETTPGFDAPLKAMLVKATELYARQQVTEAIEKNRSYRMGGNFNFKVHVGQATTPQVMPAIVAWEVTRDPKYLEAVYSTCDYMLGGNQLDMTWITGVGKQYPTQV